MHFLAPSQVGGTAISAMNYLGGFQYQDNVLRHFPTAEGHVSGSYQYVFNYTDYLGNVRLSYGWDMAEGKLKIMEENHYYPFGLKHANYNTHTLSAIKMEEGSVMTLKAAAAPSNPKPVMGYNYKYNGKEFQDELGLNLYDYGARNYDPAIGRWTTPDPLLNDLDFTFNPNDVDEDDEEDLATALQTSLANGEGIYNTDNLNPYGYGYNNPVSFDDPDGRCPICFVIAALLIAQSAEAPTGNHKTDTQSRNATAGNNTLIPSIIAGGATGNIITNAYKANSIRRTIEKGQAQTKRNESTKKPEAKSNTSDRTSKDALRRDKNGEPKPDPEASGTSHTQLGTKSGRKGDYKQGREFNKKDKPVKDIDHTDHGRPSNHPNPHQHKYSEGQTGGTLQRGKTEPLD